MIADSSAVRNRGVMITATNNIRLRYFVMIPSLRNRVYLDFNLCQEKVLPIALVAERTI